MKHYIGTTEDLPVGTKILIASGKSNTQFVGTVLPEHDVFKCGCCNSVLKLRNNDRITLA